MQVPHDAKNLRAVAKRTSQIMKHGQDATIENGQMMNIQMESGTRRSR